jgi:tetratricopeptide (TPR) repeat protein
MILSTLLLSLTLSVAPAVDESIDTARSLFDLGNYPEAVKALTAALARAPLDASVNYWLARSYYEMRSYDNAVTYAEKAVKLAPQNAEYNRWLGRAYGGKAEESHSFFTAKKVKHAFEDAVRLDPSNIEARRDLMQYCVEAPWVVGGDKAKAREQIAAIAALDPLQGRLARAAYLSADDQWKEAETEYLAILDVRPSRIEPYMETAEFFASRKDPQNLDKAVTGAARVNPLDPRLNYYRAVSFILRKDQPATAEQLLKAYVANVPERSDYPSHNSAMEWLRRMGR